MATSLPEAVGLAHHINVHSRSRHKSPLKDMIRYMGVEGMISFAGGLPHPSLFPLQSAKFTCLTPDAPIQNEVADRPENELVNLDIERTKEATLDLTSFLQYGTGAGNAELLAIARQLTDKVHSPLYNCDVLLHPGNTNAWAKVVGLLCEDGDSILVEEYTYPSSQALWIPLGMTAVPVKADAQGMSAEHLEGVLSAWPADKKRPHVLYIVSIGSNPMGLSIGLKRRQAIYDICVKYDIVIVEDDPYYFLQYPEYQLEQSDNTQPESSPLPTDAFLKTLTPSFLSIDRQGRVIRLESFSKTIFPGLRLGYFIANPVFTERLLRATEVETQDPSGLSQAFALSLLRAWGIDGYLGWMQSLQTQYRTRRDWLVGAIAHEFVLQKAADSPLPDAQGYVASLKRTSDGKLIPIFSFVDPTAGMFVWSQFYFSGVPRFETLRKQDDQKDPEQAFADELWQAWADKLVLLTPGSYYHPWQGADYATTKARGAEPATAHFRFSFATPTKEQIEQGVVRLVEVVRKFYFA